MLLDSAGLLRSIHGFMGEYPLHGGLNFYNGGGRYGRIHYVFKEA